MEPQAAEIAVLVFLGVDKMGLQFVKSDIRRENYGNNFMGSKGGDYTCQVIIVENWDSEGMTNQISLKRLKNP